MSPRFEIYARRRQDEALTHIGTMEVDGGDVKDAVRKRHGDDWLELVAIPEDTIAWAIGKE